MTKPLDELFNDSLVPDKHHVAHYPLLATAPALQRPVRTIVLGDSQ